MGDGTQLLSRLGFLLTAVVLYCIFGVAGVAGAAPLVW